MFVVGPHQSAEPFNTADNTALADDPELAPILYLDLLKRCLAGLLPQQPLRRAIARPSLREQPVLWALYSLVRPCLDALGLELSRPSRADERIEGRDWPVEAETMIGMARMQNLQDCVTDVLRNGIPGDLIEAGVWRGGAAILMRAILKAYGDREKTVWLADSFQGLPKPDGRYGQDVRDSHWRYSDVLAVSLEQVKSNFERYGLLDGQVRFLAGWFKDTLPRAPISRISVLRLDGDMYASTMDALTALYPKLSAGGYAIVDDYGHLPACREAVDDFRREHRIQEPLRKIDWTGVFWQKA